MNHWLTLFLVIVVIVLVALLALGVIGYAKLVADRSARRRKGIERERPERAEPVDLAAERYAFCSRRDAYQEARDLGRVA